MVVGIDCLSIDSNYSGGLNTYTLGLLEGFQMAGSSHEFRIFVTPKNKELFRQFESAKNFRLVEIILPVNFFTRLDWKSINLGSERIYKFLRNLAYRSVSRKIDSQCDILYTPTTTLFSFCNQVPTVLSMHDIQQVHYPEFFSKKDLLVRRILFNLSAKHSDYIQVSSRFIFEDLLKHFSCLSPSKLLHIEEGVNIPKFRNHIPDSDILKKYNLPDEFLFYPAQLWHHKNHLTVLKSLLHLKATRGISLALVLTGGKYSAADSIFDFVHQNNLENVFHLGKIPFDDIISLYKKASFMITASLHESSCLPVLEAAASGCTIVASDIAPNIEMSKKITMNIFPAMDYIALADVFARLLEEKQKNQMSFGKNDIGYYSWENIARKYIKHFETIKDGN